MIIQSRLSFTLILVLIVGLIVPTSSAAQSPSPLTPFLTSECPFDLPLGVEEGRDVVCGYVEVPEEYSDPTGATIRLALAIIKSHNPEKTPDPLYMAQGGPGGSTIETYASQLLTDRDFVPNRDIVLFDQRGTKYSEPNLYCKEVEKLIAETIEIDLSIEESERLSLKALIECRENLSTKGINLSAFDSLENAKDINSIREALGHDKINLYGVSYGSLLALHTMRLYPEILRSVILDGVVPPQTNFILGSASSMDRSFSRLFNSCKNDPSCNHYYPDLERVFFDLVERLNDKPVLIELKDSETNTIYPNAVISGDAFLSGVFQMLYVGSLIPALPRMIYDSSAGNFDFFSRIYSILLFDRSISLGMYYSVICAEDADFSPNDQDLNGIRQQISKTATRDLKFFLNACNQWNVKPLDSNVDQPVISDIPTLVLSGGFDPITPEDYGNQAASTLQNSFVFVFPAGGHGQALESDCQNGIIQSFLDDPTKRPDDTCIGKISKPAYITPDTVLSLPVVMKLLNFEENTGVEIIILFSSLALLLTAVLVIPILWLVNRLRKRKTAPTTDTLYPPTSTSDNQTLSVNDRERVTLSLPATNRSNSSPLSIFFSNSAGWIAFIAGPTLTIFLIGFVIILIQLIAKNDNRIFFGVPAVSAPWFILPLLFGILWIWMSLSGITAWVGVHWRLPTRIYYSVITVAGLVCLMILSKWGFLTVLFQ